jgi:hypothetical protein
MEELVTIRITALDEHMLNVFWKWQFVGTQFGKRSDEQGGEECEGGFHGGGKADCLTGWHGTQSVKPRA